MDVYSNVIGYITQGLEDNTPGFTGYKYTPGFRGSKVLRIYTPGFRGYILQSLDDTYSNI